MSEKTDQEKRDIVREKFLGFSQLAMREHAKGNSRPCLISVDEELERVLVQLGMDQFHGLTIKRRDIDKQLRTSRTHPARRGKS